MSVTPLRAKRIPRAEAPRKARRVYAIAFDLDGAIAERHCGPNWRGTCYAKIAALCSKRTKAGTKTRKGDGMCHRFR